MLCKLLSLASHARPAVDVALHDAELSLRVSGPPCDAVWSPWSTNHFIDCSTCKMYTNMRSVKTPLLADTIAKQIPLRRLLLLLLYTLPYLRQLLLIKLLHSLHILLISLLLLLMMMMLLLLLLLLLLLMQRRLLPLLLPLRLLILQLQLLALDGWPLGGR